MRQIVDAFDARQFLKVSNKPQVRHVCALTRVSTVHEQQTNALSNQNQWIVDEINRHPDWIFNMETDLFIDDGVSGTSTKKRTDFNTMIELAKSGHYDLIVTREVCRFMRNAKVTLTLVDELEKCGVEVYFVNDGIWSFNRDDYFKLTIMATYAEEESRKISERVFSGQATARANGIHFGTGNILGYNVVKGEKSCDTTYVIEEEGAATVYKIYSLVLEEGLGIKKIKNYLVEHGYKNSRGEVKWYESTIQRILRNRTYCGEYEYMKSVTIDPLTHERVSQLDRSKRQIKKGKFQPIIPYDMWVKVQKILDSRLNRTPLAQGQKKIMHGIVQNKDVYCRKMRCGCGRRFKKDLGRVDGTATYRCYSAIESGSTEQRIKTSQLLNDNCSINGIIDWKLDLFTLKAFEFFEINMEEVKNKLLAVIDRNYCANGQEGYDKNQKLLLEAQVKKLEERCERLVDMLADGIIDKADFEKRSTATKKELGSKQMELKKYEAIEVSEREKEQTLADVRKFIEEKFQLPEVDVSDRKVDELIIDTYINSIKACADNVFEYNIRVSSVAEVDSPLVCPEEEYNPLIHPAVKELDNSNAVLVGEILVDYDMAKAYANKLRRKVQRVHWEKPAVIKVYVNL